VQVIAKLILSSLSRKQEGRENVRMEDAMSHIIIAVLASICVAAATAQTPIPADSRDNTLVVAIENSSTWSDAESLMVRVLRSPPAVRFHADEQRVDRLEHGRSTDILFTFDVNRNASINSADTVELQVTGPQGVLWRKTSVWTFTGPATFRLEQNYPNPFNPSCIVRYALPQSARVTFTIYDVLGQRVAVMDEGMKQAGYHDVTISASGLASGVYFYRMEAGSFGASRKMVVLR